MASSRRRIESVRASAATGPGQVVRFRTSFSNTVYDVMKGRGWKETDSEHDWDVMWADREWVYEVSDSMRLENWQKLNHYRNGRELCRKDLLVKNLKRKKRGLEREGKADEAEGYDFFPTTFVLPREYSMFVEEFKVSGGVWIMKPIGSAQGKGIFMFSRLSEISEWRTDYRYRYGGDDAKNSESVEAYIVQRYISNPFLIGGKKFDLRVYVLVTSFSPLTVWFHRSGFSRFSHTRYSADPADIANTFVHLTNVAIQKTAENYDARSGGKMDLRHLKLYLIAQFGREMVDELFWRIQMLVLRSLFAVQQVMINDQHCFELYGYDIMIDDALKPWLIEVNASPSLSANTAEDYTLKTGMLNDLFDVLDLERSLRGDEEHVGGFDLIYDNGYVEVEPEDSAWSSYLGAAWDARRSSSHRHASSKTSPHRGGGGGGGGGGSTSTSSSSGSSASSPTGGTQKSTPRGAAAAAAGGAAAAEERRGGRASPTTPRKGASSNSSKGGGGSSGSSLRPSSSSSKKEKRPGRAMAGSGGGGSGGGYL